MVEQIIAIFCDIDEFLKEYERYMTDHLLTDGKTLLSSLYKAKTLEEINNLIQVSPPRDSSFIPAGDNEFGNKIIAAIKNVGFMTNAPTYQKQLRSESAKSTARQENAVRNAG